MKSFVQIVRISVCLFVISIFTLFKSYAQQNSLLWEVSGNGLSQPSYLFGTIHLICPDEMVLSDSLLSTLSKSKQLFLEIDMDDPEMMPKMMQKMQMNNGVVLSDLIEEKEYQILHKFFQDSVGLDLTMLSQVKPYFIASFLFSSALDCQPVSYETVLMELVKKDGKEVYGLETIEEQMAIFDSIPYQKQAKMIMTIIDKLPNAKAEFQELTRIYQLGDVEQLYNASKSSSFDMNSESTLMLDKRNQNWIHPMKEQMALAPTFFAFGAAHLGGEMGIIKLLQKEGYTLRPVK